MKRLIMAVIGVILFSLALSSAVKACDDDWGDDQYNENYFE